jgi:hypothetical protein
MFGTSCGLGLGLPEDEPGAFNRLEESFAAVTDDARAALEIPGFPGGTSPATDAAAEQLLARQLEHLCASEQLVIVHSQSHSHYDDAPGLLDDSIVSTRHGIMNRSSRGALAGLSAHSGQSPGSPEQFVWDLSGRESLRGWRDGDAFNGEIVSVDALGTGEVVDGAHASEGGASEDFLGLAERFSGDGGRDDEDTIGEEELYLYLAENDRAIVPHGITLERHLARIIYRCEPPKTPSSLSLSVLGCFGLLFRRFGSR